MIYLFVSGCSFFFIDGADARSIDECTSSRPITEAKQRRARLVR